MNKLFLRIRNLNLEHYCDMRGISKTVVDALEEIHENKPRFEIVNHKDREYLLIHIVINKETRTTRPIRKDLIDLTTRDFLDNTRRAFSGVWSDESAKPLERFVYTAQQVVGCYLDIFNPAAARRVAGTVFECLIASALNRVCSLPIATGTITIPNTGTQVRTDLGIYKNSKIALLIATKTSTRERISQPFVQKYIIDRTIKPAPKSIIVVIGDVQRLGEGRVQHTFVPGQFLLYWHHLTPMDGVYYIDIPPQAYSQEFQGQIKGLAQLFSTDLKQLLGIV